MSTPVWKRVERYPGSPNTISDFGRLLLLESYHLAQVLLYFLLLLIFRLWCHQYLFLSCCSSFGCRDFSAFLDGFWVPLFQYFAWIRITFLELFFWGCKKEHVVSKSHVCEAIMIAVAQTYSHSFFLLPTWNVYFQCFLLNRVEEQAWQWVTMFGSFLDLKHVGLCTISARNGCNHVRYRKIWGRPKLICGWRSRTSSWSRLSRPTFWFTTHGISDQSFCASQDGLLFGKSFWIPPDLPLGFGQVLDTICSTVLSRTVCTTLAKNRSGGSFQHLPRVLCCVSLLFSLFAMPLW